MEEKSDKRNGMKIGNKRRNQAFNALEQEIVS